MIYFRKLVRFNSSINLILYLIKAQLSSKVFEVKYLVFTLLSKLFAFLIKYIKCKIFYGTPFK